MYVYIHIWQLQLLDWNGKANSASLKLDEIPLGMDQCIPNWILYDILTNSNHLELEYLVPCKPSYWLAPQAKLTEHKAA